MDLVTHMTFQLVGSTLKEKINKVKHFHIPPPIRNHPSGKESTKFASFTFSGTMFHFLHLSLTYRPVVELTQWALSHMFDQKLPPVKTLEPPGDQPACKDPKSKTKDNAVNVDFQHLRGLFSLTWKKMFFSKSKQK